MKYLYTLNSLTSYIFRLFLLKHLLYQLYCLLKFLIGLDSFQH
nr:MAG TPA: hypothetical protein [Bacteriophage sp.]